MRAQNNEVCEVVEDTEYQSSVQYLNTLQKIVQEIQGISVNTSSDIKYLLERIQNLEEDIQTIKKCVTKDNTNGLTYPITNGLYPLANSSNIQGRLNALVGKQNNVGSNLFPGIGGSVLDQSQQRQTSLNNLIPNPQSNSLQQRMGKYTSLIEQQGPRIPLKRKQPAVPNGRRKEEVEDITVLSDDDGKNKKTKNLTDSEKNQGEEYIPLEVGSKRASNLDRLKNRTHDNGKLPLPDYLKNKTPVVANSNSIIDPKKRTNVRRVKPAIKVTKETAKQNGNAKDDVMVVDEMEDNLLEVQNIACDVIIHSGDGNDETIPEQKVDMLDNFIDHNNVRQVNSNTARGKEVDLMLDELIDSDVIKNNPDILEDILGQVPYAKSKVNKAKVNKSDTNKTKVNKSDTNKAKANKSDSKKGRPKTNSKKETPKKDEPEVVTVESNLEDNLKEFESEESGNLNLELPLMDLPLV